MESKSKNSKIGPRVLSWSKIWFNRNKKIDLETNYIFVTETEADKWPCRSLQSLKTINKNKNESIIRNMFQPLIINPVLMTKKDYNGRSKQWNSAHNPAS